MTELAIPFDAFFYAPLLLMWGALLAHWFFPSPSHFSPLTPWQHIAEAIAEKVNHAADSTEQQRLSGALALSIMCLSAATVLIALRQMIGIAGLFDFLLLWFALSWKPLTQLTLQIEQALLREDKPTARTLLAKNLNRDTLSLSSTGIAKAGCETLVIGYARGLIGVLFWYAIGGGIMALLYTLIVQLTRYWSPRVQEYAQFGLAAAALLSVIDFLPSRLFAILIALGHRCKPAIMAIIEQGKNTSANGAAWLLASCGTKFQVSLGGPAMYNNINVIRPRLGGSISPSPLHMALLNQNLKQKAQVWILLQSMLMLLFYG